MQQHAGVSVTLAAEAVRRRERREESAKAAPAQPSADAEAGGARTSVSARLSLCRVENVLGRIEHQ